MLEARHLLGMEGAATIKVLGLGGGGCSAVNRMCQEGIPGVQFAAVNTDAQSLVRSLAPVRIRIGHRLTRGLGVGGDAYLGMRAAEESRQELAQALADADMVFLAAGLGGGTGTGALPVVAELAREVGCLTIALVTTPFSFEGRQQREVAQEWIARIQEKVDTLILIPNDRLLCACGKTVTVAEAFRTADEVLYRAVLSIAEIMLVPGKINVDFADVRTIMARGGTGFMAIGYGSGESPASEAARAAIASPLLDHPIQGARRVLFNVTANDLTLFEVNEAATIIRQAADPDAQIIFGLVNDPNMGLGVRITLIATGFVIPEDRLGVSQGRLRETVPLAAPHPL